MNIFSNFYSNHQSSVAVNTYDTIVSKEIRLSLEHANVSSGEMIEICSNIQKIVSQHPAVSKHNWLGFHIVNEEELTLWKLDLKEHLMYNFLLELHSLLENKKLQWKCTESLFLWDEKLRSMN